MPVESRTGAVFSSRAYLLLPVSSGSASIAPSFFSPELREHIATFKRPPQFYAAVHNAYAEKSDSLRTSHTRRGDSSRRVVLRKMV
jgi:hypothetical protein